MTRGPALLAWWGFVGCSEATLDALGVEGEPAEPMAPAETARLTATATYSDGVTEDVTEVATWSSSDVGVIEVADGEVTAVGVGVAEVTVELDGQAAMVALAVTDPGPFAVTVSGDWGPQHGGQGLSFFARVVDDADGSVAACGSVTAEDAVWSMSAAGVLLLDHVYHAEAFADVNGNGEADDVGHSYLTEPKRPAQKDQDFEVAHAGAAPAWSGAACPAGALLE